MITYMVEKLEEILPEIEPLLHVHYEDLALNKDKVPLSPIWSNYFALERAGEFICIVVREEGVIIGYFWGFVKPSLHYSTCLTCTMDIFYIVPEKRGGRTGLKLFQFVEKELKKRGVQRWLCGSKLHKDSGSLFKYLKFDPIETYYSKWIGD